MFRVDSSPLVLPAQSAYPLTSYVPFNSDPSNLPTPSLVSPSFPSANNSYATPLTPSVENSGGGFPFGRPAFGTPASSTYPLDYSPVHIYDKALPSAPINMIEVTHFGPPEGPERTPVTVQVNAYFPPSVNSNMMQDAGQAAAKTLRVLFGSTPVQTKVGQAQPMRTHDGGERYDGLTMHASAPSPYTTGCIPPGGSIDRVSAPVYVQVLDGNHQVLETTLVGQYMYMSDVQRVGIPAFASPTVSPHTISGSKRSIDHLGASRSSPGPIRTLSSTMMRKQPSESMLPGQSPVARSHDHVQRPAYGPIRYASTPAMDYGTAQHSPVPPSFQHQYSETHEGGWNGQANGHSVPHPPQAQPIQHPEHAEGSQPPSYPSASSSSSESLPQAHLQQAPTMPALHSQPSLLRTSQLSAGNNGFNPYVAGSNKARLELQQDLNLMAVGWNNEEWNAKRRLVQFWRRQEGSTIHAAFRGISQSEYIPNSIVISCIYREDKNECFVTSVDAIYLLEALVGVRFSVEEKNRIRRNLEGFRPITVSKSKAGAEDFFKLVMGFPNPKPRNIEKDVKVFPWKVFGTALKKIIGKYSASYILPQSANMGPPQPPLLERNASPSPAPYTIPAPLMPADGTTAGLAPQQQFNPAVPYPAQHQYAQPMHSPMSAGPYGQPQKTSYDFEVNDVFLAPTQSALPPTPAASGYMGSSSSGSIPTLAHPSPVTSSTGSNSAGSGMIPTLQTIHSHQQLEGMEKSQSQASFQIGEHSPMHGSFGEAAHGGMYS